MRIVLMSLALSLAACSGNAEAGNEATAVAQESTEMAQTQAGTYENINVADLKTGLESMESGTYTLLDVRTADEIAQGKVAGAVEMDFYQNFSDASSNINPDLPVYVYCAAGGRSAKAAQQLADKGFTKVYNVLGGFGAWSAAGYAVEKP